MCKFSVENNIKIEDNIKMEDSTSNEGNLENFKITESIKTKLQSRGIKTLFPIQYKTFNHIYDGKDLIGQAKTGTGKTFAFALPVMCKLEEKDKNLKSGRKPRVLIMAPTRELINQIGTEFESIMHNKLSFLCVYGGVPQDRQVQKLNQGIDVIAGTPGRMQDLINQQYLCLDKIKYVILDEVDRMLDMGFQESVDNILNSVYAKDKKPQTLLFSATMPEWIQKISKKYLKEDTVKISLVNSGDSKAATTVEHLALQCPWRERATAIPDVMRVYGGTESRCIIFCERKRDADELATHSCMPSDCHVLHGDIPQEKRELVLKKFREGKYTTLITTNVAARGLDIPNVDLVIQCHPPSDVEDYIHRSGRTGRAGRTGVCVCFYEPKERYALQKVEQMARFKFKQISAPSAAMIVDASVNDVIASFRSIPESACQMFENSVEKLIAEFGEKKALALALAKISGKVDEIKQRSLLTSKEGFETFMVKMNDEAQKKGFLYAILKRQLDNDLAEKICAVQFIKGRKGFVFDFPSEHVKEVMDNWTDSKFSTLEKITEVPELEENDKENRFNNNNKSFNNRNFNGNRSFNNKSFNNKKSFNNDKGGFKRKFNGDGGYPGNSKLQKF